MASCARIGLVRVNPHGERPRVANLLLNYFSALTLLDRKESTYMGSWYFRSIPLLNCLKHQDVCSLCDHSLT